MKKNKISFSSNYFIITGIYLIIGLLLLPYYQYSIGQDIISYLSISNKYLSGNLHDAVNGVWGPMISWFLVPFLIVNIPVFLSFKILQLILGACFLGLLLYFFKGRITGKKTELLIFISLLPLLYVFVFFTGTPDLLLTVLLLLYLIFLKKKKYLANDKYGILCGAIAAFAYYAKAYALPFFLIHFIVINLYYYKKGYNKKIIIKNCTGGIVTFVLLAALWILPLSIKYGYLTYSTAGSYNFNVVGPAYQGIHSFRIEKLYPPVNPTAVSYWEDPSFLKLEEWNPIASLENIQYLAGLVLKNIRTLFFSFLIYTPIYIILFWALFKKKYFKNEFAVFLFLTVTIYLLGYSILFLELRFLILPLFLTMISAFLVFKKILDNSSLKKLKGIFYILFIVSVTLRPLFALFNNVNEGEKYFQLVENLKKIELKGNVAGLSPKPLAEDWANTLFLAYSLNLKFYGEVKNKDINAIYNQLKDFEITYLLVWDNDIAANEPVFDLVYQTDLNDKKYIQNKYNYFTGRILSIFNIKSGKQESNILKIYKINYGT